MKLKKQLIAILGPTASGKSELAVFLAKLIKKHKWGTYERAEIISADSRQVYKYLDVGTNKVPGKWRTTVGGWSSEYSELQPPIFIYKDIPHHCIDFVHPRKIYTVAEYKIRAEKVITEIMKRGNVPILVGGTGLYIQAVADGLLLPEVAPNKKLRALLEKRSTAQLFDILKKLDPERARAIDSKNPRRLIRAIEICKATGKQIPKLNSHSEFQTLFIGIKKNDEELKHAIEKRSRKQIPGVLQEIALLKKMHVPLKRICEFGFEYGLGLKYLQTVVMPNLIQYPVKLEKNGSHTKHGMTKNELAIMLAKGNWRYAKRQMTWFKRDKRIQWIQEKDEALHVLRKFLIT